MSTHRNMALLCTLLCTYNRLCVCASRSTIPGSATSNLSNRNRRNNTCRYPLVGGI